MAQAIFEKAVLHVISDIQGGSRPLRHAPPPPTWSRINAGRQLRKSMAGAA